MKKFILFVIILVASLAAVTRVRYGGGDPYPDLSTSPLMNESELEEVVSYPEPIGNVAVSSSGRVFFTVHPESRPPGNKLLEFITGAAEPFPNGAMQSRLFDTVLGIVIDSQDRLWTIDHGNHGMRAARLLAFDLDTGELIHDQVFDKSIAPAGSFLQDLQVSSDGRTVVIADASFWRKAPAIIVYDITTATARRVLGSHSSVSAEDFIIRNHGREMTYFGGIAALRGGVDGIALGPEWLYYGALSGSSLYRVRLDALTNASLSNAELEARVERVASKPLSDGLSIDVEGNVYGADVEHGSIFRVTEGKAVQTLLRSTRIRWPDALSFGPDGWLYLADSALADVVLQPRDHIKAQGPYKIFRLRPGAEGRPGH
jgi:sugar lactone lactonase YvrE